VAHAASFYRNEDLPGFGFRLSDFLNGEGLLEFVQDSSLHGEDPIITAERRAGKTPRHSARVRSAYVDR
jgi:hypothetical protein